MKRPLKIIIGEDRKIINIIPNNMAGFQGEHNATTLTVTLPLSMIGSNIDYYRLKFTLKNGTNWESRDLNIEDGAITYDLPQNATMFYGKLDCVVVAIDAVGGTINEISKSSICRLNILPSIDLCATMPIEANESLESAVSRANTATNSTNTAITNANTAATNANTATSNATNIYNTLLTKSTNGDFIGPQGVIGNTGATGATGDTGAGVATGGTAGQALVKNSATDYDTVWQDLLASPTLTGTPVAPTAAVSTNTTQIATTAYVKSQGYLTAVPVTSVASRTGAVTLSKSDVGLGSVDNTADSAKNVLSATKLTTARTVSVSGDASGSASFDGSANAVISTTLANSGVTAGTYPKVTVDAKGRVTSGSALVAADIPLLPFEKVNGLGNVALFDAGYTVGMIPMIDIDGKLPASILPSIAITDTFEVASQAAMLALTVEIGDIAVRSDLNKTFILKASPATTLANWVELKTPTDAVLSVAGRTGAVTLSKSDVGLGSADNTADSAKNVLSATKLTTARTINGVSFNGTANITVADSTKETALGNPTTNGYVLSSTTSGTRSWIAIPSAPVTSVAGRTGVVTLTATDVGLANVTNESKATMFTSSALTGTPTAPTAAAATSTTQIATTAFVMNAVGSGGGSSTNVIGSSTFNTTTGRVISHTLNTTAYTASVTATANPSGTMGEVWVTKAANSMTVYNSGTFTGAFDYVLSK